MPDGYKRHRRQYGNGKFDAARSAWYAKHRQIRFTKRFGF